LSEERFYHLAIVGMAGRFAGADDLTAFWDNLRRGVDSLSDFTDEELEDAGVPHEVRAHPAYVRRRGVLRGAERFDAPLFDVSPREARILDPQQRVFLECAWEALEDAGCDPARADFAIGVYAGASQSSWFLSRLLGNPEALRSAGALEIRLGNDKDFLATRISYRLNLRGPSINVNTACSTALVAVHLACQGLLNRECDLALAGGVSIQFPQTVGYLFEPGDILSPDGRCRAFDAEARGSVGGDGAGIVVLKRLDDALRDGDQIRAVIRGSAVNNDGALKIGFTAPSVEGQAAVVAEAQSMAGVEPDTITYVEAHGSGTPLGDPIEIRALTRAFRRGTAKTGFCAVGSVKTNVGHCDSAAGAAGLIKTVLALENRLIPPSLHVNRPNPEIGFEETPFQVATRLTEWRVPEGRHRRAGVSSFGMGGTNAHLVLEEAPEPAPTSPSLRKCQLLALSAATPAALEAATDRLAVHLKAHSEMSLADAAWTLQTGRRALQHRRALVCRDAREAVEALAGRDPRQLLDGVAIAGRPVAFLFPGLGDHYPGMARGLYDAEPVFRREIDRGAGVLGMDPLALLPAPSAGEGGGPDLKRMLGRAADTGSAGDTALDQPAVFLVEMALARLWEAWGLRPVAALGYSLGEYSAACLAGVFSFEDGLRLVAERARILGSLPAGAMLAVSLGEDRLAGLLKDGLTLAAVNAPELCVAAGPVPAVDALAARLAVLGVACRRLPTSHAFHSPEMAPAAAGLLRLLRTVELKPPRLAWVSNVTGTWISTADATDPGYWVRHLLGTVRFAEGLRTLCQEPSPVLLEVGPGHGLSTLALQQSASGDRIAVPSLRPAYDPRRDDEFLTGALGRLWLAGVEIDWNGWWEGERRRKVTLPTYPFQRQLYSFDPPRHAEAALSPVLPETAGGAADPAPAVRGRSEPHAPGAEPQPGVEEGVAAVWREILHVDRVGRHDSFFALGGHSLLAPRVLARLSLSFGVDLPLIRLLEAPTVAQVARAVEVLQQGGGEGLLDDETLDLERDVQLDPSIRPESTELGDLSNPAAVVLTGATGFLGAFLLRELLDRTRATVHCLVRAGNAAEARERLLDNLAALRLGGPPGGLPAAALERIVAVPGDLAEPRWGLDGGDFRRLAETAEAVYHCGAWVNFTYPYRTLKPANVGGTEEALRLAALGRAKPVHFVSTLAVFGLGSFTAEGLGLEDSPLRDAHGLGGGYAQSKWVAEKLLGLARERGIRSAIYRPGLVSGDSRTGVGNLRDLMWAFLKGCVQMGAAPDLSLAFDPVPADWLGRAVVHLSRQRASLDRAFHFFHPHPIPWRDVFRFARERGWPLELLPGTDWDRRLAAALERGDDNALAPFRPLLRDGLLAADLQQAGTPFRFDARNARSGVAGIPATPGDGGPEPPPLDAALLACYFAWFVASGFLTAPAVAGEEILR
jgi:phthiocerol/phenolphthiocerol synthesis type-I polyketide synthase E